MSAATKNPHTVTVTLDTDGNRDGVRFECTAARTDPCHVYPDGEEQWDEDRRLAEGIEHDECWIQGWFDGDCYQYRGEDAIDDGGPDSLPHVARSGPIEIEFEYEWISWDFVSEADR